MSYVSNADRELDLARRDLRECLSHLSQVVVEECEGSEFYDSRKNELNDVFSLLLQAKKLLN